MDSEWKQKWIDALESGKYQHTKRHLRDADGYCCLGVLCDISGIDKWNKEEGWDGVDWFSYGNRLGMSEEIYKVVGVGKKRDRVPFSHLVDINDADDTVDFTKQIEYIKENL